MDICVIVNFSVKEKEPMRADEEAMGRD